ncbi:MAG: DUF4920 domain-containing protein [Thermoanaerobaculia bacterium]
MKLRLMLSLSGLVMLFGLGASAGSGPEPHARFGEPIDAGLELTPIASIVSDPDAWVGKRVQVAGEVSGVCTRQGCWLDLVSTGDAAIRVKVDDGVIVFPQEAVGHQAVAEGEVEILELDRDRYQAWLEHVAGEEGRKFDPAEVGDPPYRIVRLRGAGAEIEGI